MKLNKYRTVLIGSSNIAAEHTETCWLVRSRMETRYEVAQEQLSENDIVVSRYSGQAAVILPGIAWECPEMLTKWP